MKFRIHQLVTISLFFAFGLFIMNCSMLAKKNKTNEFKENKASRDQSQQEFQEEQLLGQLLLENFVRNYGVITTPPNMTNYIILVGQNLSIQFGRQELEYKFAILNSDEINAYSLPSGYVFLTKGLLKKINTESELAGVLGHEIAHVNQRHIFRSVKKNREVGIAETLSSVLSMGKASMSNALTQAVGESVLLLTKNGLSKDQEFEADEFGINFAAQAGYKVDEYTQFLNRLSQIQEGSNLSNTHPPFVDRIKKIKNMIALGQIPNQMKWDTNSLNQRFQSLSEINKITESTNAN